MDQVSKTQSLIEGGPLSFVAAFFAVVAFSLLWLYVRAKDAEKKTAAEAEERHAREIAEVHKSYTDRLVKLEVSIYGLLEVSSDIKTLAADARRRTSRREVTGVKRLTPEQQALLASVAPKGEE